MLTFGGARSPALKLLALVCVPDPATSELFALPGGLAPPIAPYLLALPGLNLPLEPSEPATGILSPGGCEKALGCVLAGYPDVRVDARAGNGRKAGASGFEPG
jgi:hypothetical protein